MINPLSKASRECRQSGFFLLSGHSIPLSKARNTNRQRHRIFRADIVPLSKASRECRQSGFLRLGAHSIPLSKARNTNRQRHRILRADIVPLSKALNANSHRHRILRADIDPLFEFLGGRRSPVDIMPLLRFEREIELKFFCLLRGEIIPFFHSCPRQKVKVDPIPVDLIPLFGLLNGRRSPVDIMPLLRFEREIELKLFCLLGGEILPFSKATNANSHRHRILRAELDPLSKASRESRQSGFLFRGDIIPFLRPAVTDVVGAIWYTFEWRY
ncbi:hypothetical protein N7456_013211 [Penicillium angulare]|uniref:Uncharacterized protein n=1 Tax=Penicillium angulare TaxID=116970 RepID=A0A9W9ELA3_9EURO|nr:hypothetical protein N7456_013211 [Penicillium angulare]